MSELVNRLRVYRTFLPRIHAQMRIVRPTISILVESCLFSFSLRSDTIGWKNKLRLPGNWRKAKTGK